MIKEGYNNDNDYSRQNQQRTTQKLIHKIHASAPLKFRYANVLYLEISLSQQP